MFELCWIRNSHFRRCNGFKSTFSRGFKSFSRRNSVIFNDRTEIELEIRCNWLGEKQRKFQESRTQLRTGNNGIWHCYFCLQILVFCSVWMHFGFRCSEMRLLTSKSSACRDDCNYRIKKCISAPSQITQTILGGVKCMRLLNSSSVLSHRNQPSFRRRRTVVGQSSIALSRQLSFA